MIPILQTPFMQITLPLMVTFIGSIWAATFMQNKRLDDIIARLSRIEARLDKIDEWIVKVEHRLTVGR